MRDALTQQVGDPIGVKAITSFLKSGDITKLNSNPFLNAHLNLAKQINLVTNTTTREQLLLEFGKLEASTSMMWLIEEEIYDDPADKFTLLSQNHIQRFTEMLQSNKTNEVLSKVKEFNNHQDI